jgi:hypothetical protein
LFGIESSNALSTLLFSNVAAMTLIGFTAHPVADGLSTRGAKQRTAASEYTLMDPQTLAHAICKISAPALQDLSMARFGRWQPVACSWPRSWWPWMVPASSHR